MAVNSTQRIADHARDLRHAAKLSLEDVAQRTGFKKQTIWSFENGKTVSASVRLVNALAACYGVPVEELINATGKPRLASETMDAMAFVQKAVEAAYRRGFADGQKEQESVTEEQARPWL